MLTCSHVTCLFPKSILQNHEVSSLRSSIPQVTSSEVEESRRIGLAFRTPDLRLSEWTKDRQIGDNNTFRLKHDLTGEPDKFTRQIFSLNLIQQDQMGSRSADHVKEIGHHCFVRYGRRHCDIKCPIYVFRVGQHPPRIRDYLERSFMYGVKFGRRF